MVRLRVAVRVIPEDDYLKSIENSANSVRGERRLVVIVREPYKWQMGTLALEIQRAYRSCYQHELPTIKYLKDNEDDCDLDPQLFVSDVLLDEGKAARDGSDQRVTIKVILEQGRRVREGSVAVGSQLDYPQFQLQLQANSRPPVPTFPGVSSALGKRPSSPTENHALTTNGVKRARHIEIPETQPEESLVSSIERDEHLGSPELVRATQVPSSQEEHVRQPSGLLGLKQEESPEFWRSWEQVQPATVDELEELREKPPTFATSRSRRSQLTNGDDFYEPQNQTAVAQPSNEPIQLLPRQSQAPITPPSEASRRRSISAARHSHSVKDAASRSAQRSATSASKFKRRDIYDFPESDIDDSQMSPQSRQIQLGHPPINGLARIEGLQSPREHENETSQRLGHQEILDALDNGSVFDDAGVLAQGLQPSAIISNGDGRNTTDDSENDIFEDAPMDDDSPQGLTQQNTTIESEIGEKDMISSEAGQLDGDKENRPSGPLESSKAIASSEKSMDPHPISTNRDDRSASRSASVRSEKRNRKRNRISRSDIKEGASPRGKNVETPAKRTGKASKKTSDLRRTPSLDSPGEQLSQSLQESARKQTAAQERVKKLTTKQNKTPASKKSEKKDEQPGKSSQGSEEKVASEENTSNPSPTKKNKPKAGGNITAPDIVVNPSTPTKPLPHWGSGSITATDKEKPTAHDKTGSLDVHKTADSRKSPSVGLGLTEEEIKIMKSREGMTKEEYEEEKKRKQAEAKKQAEEQKRQESAAKRKASTSGLPAEKKPATEKSETPARGSTKKTARESLPADKTSTPSWANKVQKSTIKAQPETGKSTPSTGNSRAESVRRESTSLTSSSKGQKKEPSVTPKTPGKQPAKTAVSKTPKPSAEKPSVEEAASTTSKKSAAPQPKQAEAKATKTTSATKTNKTAASKPDTRTVSSTNTPRAQVYPTLETATRLTDLHRAMKNASKAVNTTTTALLSRTASANRQGQKPLSLHPSSEDDDSSSDSDSSDSDAEANKKAAEAAKKKQQTNAVVHATPSSGSSSSASSSSSSEMANKKKQSTAVKEKVSQGAKKPLGRPDPSIRDESVDSDDDDEDEDDEL